MLHHTHGKDFLLLFYVRGVGVSESSDTFIFVSLHQNGKRPIFVKNQKKHHRYEKAQI